jgi:hypothetical protein
MADWRQWARRLSGRKASEAGKPGTARQLGIPLGILTGIQYCRLRIARIPQRPLLSGVRPVRRLFTVASVRMAGGRSLDRWGR